MPAEVSSTLAQDAALGELHPPGSVRDARDTNTPFRFVEGLYSLGQWISPHRLEHLQQLLWYHAADLENGIYRCVNHYSKFKPLSALESIA